MNKIRRFVVTKFVKLSDEFDVTIELVDNISSNKSGTIHND